MADKIYIVEGRQFKTEADRRAALRDQQLIEKLRGLMKGADLDTLRRISKNISDGKYKFETVLGDDFVDELDDAINAIERKQRADKYGKYIPDRDVPGREVSSRNNSNRDIQSRNNSSRDIQSRNNSSKDISSRNNSSGDYSGRGSSGMNSSGRVSSGRDDINSLTSRYYDSTDDDAEVMAYARRILKKKEKRRKTILIVAAGVAVASLAFFIVNSVLEYRQSMTYEVWNNLKDKSSEASEGSSGSGNEQSQITINYTETGNQIEAVVLDEYADLLKKNSKLIGWITIEDTNIDYPVMQTVDNEYYLSHDMNQNEDRNGAIFLDTNCDVLKPSTNFILYGHHMASGKMFGNLGKYESEDYYKKHKYITFDTIYEHGTYEVMYVFRSHVFNDDEVAFKYYQFYDANSAIEFDSYMNEMAEMSFYETGVSATYGDRLLTLSTCDYEEANGRFVVVAKKIK